jgi:hypothetical protein
MSFGFNAATWAIVSLLNGRGHEFNNEEFREIVDDIKTCETALSFVICHALRLARR